MNEPRNPMTTSRFLAQVADRDLTVGVIGLGYTGLPLAIASAEAGFTVTGYDADARRCATLNRGVSHIEDVPDPAISAMISAGRFTAVPGPGLDPVTDVVFMCVPTPFGREPDLSYVRAAAEAVAQRLRPGMLVIGQSTSYPGTTTDVIQPILEAGGLRAGSDFSLAFAPERIDPGNDAWNLRNTARVVGGVTADCTRRASAVLAAITGDPRIIHPVTSPAVAEFSKLLENSYRLVNIALVNEMAQLAHTLGIDIGEVIDAAATKPYGFQAFRPGVGPGGACIPEDPLFLAWKAREVEFTTRLIDLANQENQGMAGYVAARVMELMSRAGRGLGGSRVLCVGAAYKAGIADIRHSRALRVMELLTHAGAAVSYSDPMIPSIELAGMEVKSVALDAVDVAEVDLVVVLVAGPGLDLRRFLDHGVPVFDAARALPPLDEWPGQPEPHQPIERL